MGSKREAMTPEDTLQEARDLLLGFQSRLGPLRPDKDDVALWGRIHNNIVALARLSRTADPVAEDDVRRVQDEYEAVCGEPASYVGIEAVLKLCAQPGGSAAPDGWRESVRQAIGRARVFDDGSDGADAESARSVVAILSGLLAVAPRPSQPQSLPPLVGTLASLPKHVRECVVEYGKACAVRAQPSTAKELRDEWPQWKKDVALTKFSAARPANMTGADQTVAAFAMKVAAIVSGDDPCPSWYIRQKADRIAVLASETFSAARPASE